MPDKTVSYTELEFTEASVAGLPRLVFLRDRYLEATGLTHLGDTHRAADDHETARDAWQQALTILDDLEHPDADSVRAKLHDLAQTTPEDPDHAQG